MTTYNVLQLKHTATALLAHHNFKAPRKQKEYGPVGVVGAIKRRRNLLSTGTSVMDDRSFNWKGKVDVTFYPLAQWCHRC